MAFQSLENQFISASFGKLVQVSGSELANGLGVNLSGSTLQINVSSSDTTISASYADLALNAGFATSSSLAANSISSSFATTAQSATSASHALSSNTATSASHAVQADNALSADTATSASHAVQADSALSSNTATSASHAVQADNALSSNTATSASHAVQADSALTATSASHAVQADSALAADSATSASFAITASYAINVPIVETGSLLETASISDATITFEKADASTFDLTVNNVVSSSHAVQADSALAADSATSASHALQADNSISASRADSAALADLATLATDATYAQNTITTGKNLSGGEIVKGTPLYFTASGTLGNLVGVYPADAGNPNRMPAGGIAGETLADEAEGIVILDGYIGGVNTSTFASGDSVYVAVGGGYTNIKPTGSANQIQFLGNVEKSAINGSGVITMMGEAHSLPNIQENYLWVGNSDGVPTATDKDVLSVGTASLALDVISTANLNVTTITASSAVFTSASIGYIESITGSAKIIGDAYIILNNNTPAERYAGLVVQDSGSAGVTASLEFDGQTNDWFYEYSDDGGATTDHGVVIFGPEYNTKGSPTYNTANTILKSDGGHHVLDSNITDNGTKVIINSNSEVTGSLDVKGDITAEVVEASVNFAGNLIGNASTATSASHAVQADSSLIANTASYVAAANIDGTVATATSASHAVQADSALVADTVTSASHAVQADNALSADTATSASHAVQADSALVADTVTSASHAVQADSALVADTVTSASHAVQADTASIALAISGGVESFPYTGSAQITGSLGVTGSTEFDVSDSTDNFVYIDGNEQDALEIIGSVFMGSVNQRQNNPYNSFIQGEFNTIAGGAAGNSAIVGARNSEINGTAQHNTIAGGLSNVIANTERAFIGGGDTNTIGADNSAIVGGKNNTVSSGHTGSVILGGDNITTDAADTVYVNDLKVAGSVVGGLSIEGGDFAISSSVAITGSVSNDPIAISITSNTASMDCSLGNSFTLVIAQTTPDVHLNATNIKPGQSVNLKISSALASPASVNFGTMIEFAGGTAFETTTGAAFTDIMSFVSFDSSTLYATGLNDFS